MTGLRQGDALFWPIFNIALESVMRKTQSDVTGIRMGNHQELAVAAYAAVIIMDENEDDLKRITWKLMEKSEKIWFTVNE